MRSTGGRKYRASRFLAREGIKKETDTGAYPPPSLR